MHTSQGPIWIAELNGTYLGDIWTARSNAGLVAVDLWGIKERFVAGLKKMTCMPVEEDPHQLAEVTKQLQEYLVGARHHFEFAIDWSYMTSFQQTVLRIVLDIEYGRTQTYGDIARQLGKPKAVRAVGRANAANPMPIIIPCHRVLGSDGRLHGYSAPGGLETKARLLRLEGSWLI